MAQSAVGNLKDALDDFAQMANRAAEGMEDLKKQYQGLSEQVLSLIAGTSTGKDSEVTGTIEQAGHAVSQAQESLGEAGRIAREYGGTI